MNLFSNPAVGPLFELRDDLLASSGSGINVSGLQAVGSVGLVAIRINTSVSVTGLSSTGSLGTVTISVSAAPAPTGLSASALVHGVSVSAGGTTNVSVSGLSLTGSVGIVTEIIDAAPVMTGLNANALIGQALAAKDCLVTPIGIVATGSLGNITRHGTAFTRSFDPTSANLSGAIRDLVVEDDYDLVRNIEGIPVDATIVEAWLTIKISELDSDTDAIIQKEITPISSAAGQITDDGSTDAGSGQVLFQLNNQETALLVAERSYFYDIQVKSSSGKYSTREKGALIPVAQVTDSL